MELNLTGRSKHDTPEELASLSAVLIHGDEIFIDNGAIHGKSRLERGVDFRSARSEEEVPGGVLIPVIWVTLKRFEAGMGYGGVCAATLFINVEQKMGYKNMAALVNQMDRAMKGKIDIGVLNGEQKEKLTAFLQTLRPDLWANTPAEVMASLA